MKRLNFLWVAASSLEWRNFNFVTARLCHFFFYFFSCIYREYFESVLSLKLHLLHPSQNIPEIKFFPTLSKNYLHVANSNRCLLALIHFDFILCQVIFWKYIFYTSVNININFLTPSIFLYYFSFISSNENCDNEQDEYLYLFVYVLILSTFFIIYFVFFIFQLCFFITPLFFSNRT